MLCEYLQQKWLKYIPTGKKPVSKHFVKTRSLAVYIFLLLEYTHISSDYSTDVNC